MEELDRSQHLTEEQLVWHYYGEEEAGAVQPHLDLCRQCTDNFRAIQSAMASIDTLTIPNPGRDYEDRLWRALAGRERSLQSRTGRWRRMWQQMLSPRPLVLAGGIMTLLLAAFLAGRLSAPAPGGVDMAAAPDVVRERLLIAALSDHLEQSERVLVEINAVEIDPASSKSGNRGLRNERQRAENLLAANRLYRQTAALEGKTSLAATLDDLERVLLEVAHSPDRPSPGQLRELQARIEDQGLLFKVQTLGLRLRQLDQQPVTRPPGPANQPTKSMKG